MINEYVKFCIILICFSLVIFNKKWQIDSKSNTYLSCAMFFTVFADFFLVILNIYTLGVFVFCFAHVFHIRRYGGNFSKFYLIILILPIIAYFWFYDLLVSLALLYAQFLILSCIWAIITAKRQNMPFINANVILAGMGLFLLCDISVALSYAATAGFISKSNISHIANVLIWLFYVPSQLLLAFSGYNNLNNLCRRRSL